MNMDVDRLPCVGLVKLSEMVGNGTQGVVYHGEVLCYNGGVVQIKKCVVKTYVKKEDGLSKKRRINANREPEILERIQHLPAMKECFGCNLIIPFLYRN